MTPKPKKIGVPRVESGAAPTLYPGEQAIAIDARVVSYADERGVVTVTVQAVAWAIEPMPGLSGVFYRWRWRLFGRFFGGSPRLEATMRVSSQEDE